MLNFQFLIAQSYDLLYLKKYKIKYIFLIDIILHVHYIASKN